MRGLFLLLAGLLLMVRAPVAAGLALVLAAACAGCGGGEVDRQPLPASPIITPSGTTGGQSRP